MDSDEQRGGNTMVIERMTRRELFANAPPLSDWPTCAEEGIRDVELFRQRCTAMRMYAELCPVVEIVEVTGIVRSQLSVWAKRCLAIADDGRIFGFRALIPYARPKLYARHKVSGKKLPGMRGGMAGALQQLLAQYPDLESQIVALIKKDRKRWPYPHEFRIRARDVHRHFIGVLKALNAPTDRWPFTADYKGRRSITQFTRDIIYRHFARSVSQREKSDARAHLAVGRGKDPLLLFEEPFAAVEIDAYKIDAHMTMVLQTPEGTEVEQLLERLWLLAVVERASTAVLAWLVVYHSEVRAADVVRVIRLAATEGLNACTKAIGIPNLPLQQVSAEQQQTIEFFDGAQWGATLFDNALAHLANAVHDNTRKALGWALNYGPVRHFERRPTVERTFKAIHDDVFQRLPSTTGSHPHAYRADDAEQQAMRWRIRAADVEELAAAYFAEHNLAATNQGLSNLTPIEFLQYFALHEDQHLLVRRLPQAQQDRARTLGIRIRCVVRGNLKAGRRPYIQLDDARYTSSVLANAGALIGTELFVDVLDDFRHVRAFLPSGAELGYLTAQGRWGLTPHSRETRQAINRLITRGILKLAEREDPVQAYLRHIGTRSKHSKKQLEQQGPLTKRNATTLARVAREAGVAPSIYAVPPAPAPEAPPTAPSRGLMDTPLPDFSTVKNRR